MFKKLEKNIALIRDIEDIYLPKIKLLHMKTIITEMKNTWNGINTQLYIEKEKIHKPENNSRNCLK